MGEKGKIRQCSQCQSPLSDDSHFCSRCGHFVVDKADTLTYTPPLEKILDDHLVFSPGDMFGPRYRIIEEIGRGGMGRVYKAKDLELNITVALKMIRAAYSSNPRFIQRFKEETLLSRSISHENVIRIHDIGDVDEIKFISMDYIKGQDLKELIHTSGTLSIQAVISITRQICEGLKAAHQKNIVHLDLKPRNIMIDSDGKVYLMDFGVARSLGVQETVQENKLIGTPAYISPEQAKNEEVDTRTDIYSLGIIIFEMLTGKRPFDADNLDDYIRMHIHKKPARPSEIMPRIPPFLDMIVLRCLKKDKNRRYQNITDMLDDLRAHEEESQTYIPQVKKKKARRSILLVPIVLMAVIGVYLLVAKKGPSPFSRPPTSSRSLGGKVSMAVMVFENHTGDRDLEEWRMGLCYLIISDLQQSELIKVLPSDGLFSILKNLNLVDQKNYSSEDLKKVSLRSGADHILYGHYTKADDVYRIDVMLKNIRTDEMESQKFEGKGEIMFLKTADRITQWAKSKLHIAGADIAADSDKDIQDIFTDSPEALKLYIQGKQHYYLGDFEGSNDILEKAIRLDKEFALALRQISENYHYLGKIDLAKQYARSAVSIKDKVSRRDGYVLEGWARTILEDSYINAEKIYVEMLQNYPDDEDANIYLGAIYRNMEKWDLAKERFERILNINPILATDNILLFLKALGQYEKAITLIQTNEDKFHSPAAYHLALGNIYLYQKKYDLSLIECQEALSLESDLLDGNEMMGHLFLIQDKFDLAEYHFNNMRKSENPVARTYGKFWSFSLRIARGQFSECIRAIRDAIKESEKLQLKSEKSAFLNLLSYAYLRTGQFDKALDASIQAEKSASELNFYLDKIAALHLRGMIQLDLNHPADTEKTMSELKNYIESIKISKFLRYYYHLAGMLAMHSNNITEAVENFDKAISMLSFQHEAMDDHALHIYPLAMAYKKADDNDRALEQFKKIADLTTGRIQFGDIYAKSFYWQGKIFREQGQKHSAYDCFKRFLELWKNADPMFPEIEDAKRLLLLLSDNETDALASSRRAYPIHYAPSSRQSIDFNNSLE